MDDTLRSRRRVGRPARGQEPLTRARIIHAALRLVDEQGLDQLSMRRLGAELGVNPMSLYHHVAGKEALIGGLIDAVYAEMRLPPAVGMPWQARVRAWAVAYLELAQAHPNLVLRIVADATATSRAMLTISEPLYAALEQAGLAPHAVTVAADTIADLIHGAALALVNSSSAHRSAEHGLLAALAAQPAGSAPALRRVYEALEASGSEPSWTIEHELALVLKGIEVVAAADDAHRNTIDDT